MVQDIFISYAKEDASAADTFCSNLEKEGIRCWIAPRNIAPGEKYATAIIQAIENAKIVVVVFSRNSDQSAHVRTEIERAFNQGKTIIPIRIENIEPSEELQYFLGSRQWLDAFTGPLDNHINRLAEIIRRNFNSETEFDPIKEKRLSPPLYQAGTALSEESEHNKLLYLFARTASYCIDYGIGFIVGLLFCGVIIGFIPAIIGQENFNHLWYISGSSSQVTPFSTWAQWTLILTGIITWLIVIDSSRFRSPGKALLGLNIHWPPDTMNFRKRKLIRTLVKNLPLLVLFLLTFLSDGTIAFYIYLVLCTIWIIPIIFTAKSQSFHDRITGTYVLLKKYHNLVKI